MAAKALRRACFCPQRRGQTGPVGRYRCHDGGHVCRRVVDGLERAQVLTIPVGDASRPIHFNDIGVMTADVHDGSHSVPFQRRVPVLVLEEDALTHRQRAHPIGHPIVKKRGLRTGEEARASQEEVPEAAARKNPGGDRTSGAGLKFPR